MGLGAYLCLYAYVPSTNPGTYTEGSVTWTIKTAKPKIVFKIWSLKQMPYIPSASWLILDC